MKDDEVLGEEPPGGLIVQACKRYLTQHAVGNDKEAACPIEHSRFQQRGQEGAMQRPGGRKTALPVVGG